MLVLSSRSYYPHTSHLTPHTSHLTPHTSHLTPHTSHLTPHTSHLTPHTSHLTPHTSHLTPHTSLLTPHTSHLKEPTRLGVQAGRRRGVGGLAAAGRGNRAMLLGRGAPRRTSAEPLRASSSAAGREPVGGNELLGSLANPLLHLVDSVSRDVAVLGHLIDLIVSRHDNL